MEIKQKPMSAPEISNLWMTYQSNALARCVLKYFSAKAEDEKIKATIDMALRDSQNNYEQSRALMDAESIPIPTSFTDSDVNVNAPRLMTDMLMLQYVKQMANIGMLTYGPALYSASRADVRDFYDNCLKLSIEIDHKATQTLLESGIYLQLPYLNAPPKADIVKDQSFLTGWFGNRRQLIGTEITNLFLNMITNSIGKAFMTSFAQVSELKEIRKFFIRGKHISAKHLSIFDSILKQNDIDVPGTWDSHITDSTIAPFSDKLMLIHTLHLTSFGATNYGASLSMSPRRDLAVRYERLLHEVLLYNEDGLNLLIKHGWMDEPPKTTDRNELIKKGKTR